MTIHATNDSWYFYQSFFNINPIIHRNPKIESYDMILPPPMSQAWIAVAIQSPTHVIIREILICFELGSVDIFERLCRQLWGFLPSPLGPFWPCWTIFNCVQMSNLALRSFYTNFGAIGNGNCDFGGEFQLFRNKFYTGEHNLKSLL